MIEENNKMKKNVDHEIKKSYAKSLAEQRVSRLQMKVKEKQEDAIYA